ncbi:MAG: gliding motility-associated C-terminal domain-containing protein [Bacteroidota bacterium]
MGLSQVKANHIAGAEIYYRCVDPVNNRYEITIVVYRDCNLTNNPNNVGFDNPITVFIFRGNGSLQQTINIAAPTSTPRILPPNWNACTNIPYTICVERGEYRTVVTLPPRTDGYDIGWARCCRNNVITNLTTNPNQGITTSISIPGTNTLIGCNSSPVYRNVPPQFLCLGQSFTFDHSATDVDGDSLVYSICDPYTGVNTLGQGARPNRPTVTAGGFFANPMGAPPYQNAAFNAGYSATNAFGGNNFNIDSRSGLMTLTPPQVGVFVFAICVSEYRNGRLLSVIKRDFQINVINCIPQGNPPTTISLPPGGNSTVRVEPGDTICYPVQLNAATAGDSVLLAGVSAAFGVGGSFPTPLASLTVTTANPNPDSVLGEVCWVPQCVHAGDTAMLIVAGNNISDCFGFNLAFDTVTVIVGGATPPTLTHFSTIGGNNRVVTVDANRQFCYTYTGADADRDDTVQVTPVAGPFTGLNAAVFTNNGGINPNTGTVCWTPTCDDAGQTFIFVLEANDNGPCNIRRRVYDTVEVRVRPLAPMNLRSQGPTVICNGQSTSLRVDQFSVYNWAPATGLSNTISRTVQASPTTTTTYTVQVTDSLGCIQTDSITVTVNPLPVLAAIADTFVCPDDTITLTTTAVGGGGGYAYAWTPTTSVETPNAATTRIFPTNPITYTVTVTDVNGCQDTEDVYVATLNITSGPDQTICFGDTVPLSAGGGAVYTWNNAGTLDNANIANPRAFPGITTDYVVSIQDTNNCVDTDTIRVNVNPLPVINPTPDTAICIGDNFRLRSFGGTQYQWTPTTGLTGANTAIPLAQPTVTTTYTVRVTDANTCVNEDSVVVTVNPLPNIFAGNDTAKCGNVGVPLTATGGVIYTWTPAIGLSATNINNPVANPDSSTSYTVTGIDANGCINTDQINVRAMYGTVGPDPTICFGDTAPLSASGGVAYQWNNGVSLTNDTIAAPGAFPGLTTQYIVNIFDTTGCFDPDTVNVLVNPLPVVAPASDAPAICIGDSVGLSAFGGISYQWSPQVNIINANTSNPTVFPTSTQQYFVDVVDANGCRNRDSLTIVVNPLPIVDAGNDTAKCGNVGVTLTATGGVGFAWTPALGLSNTTTASPVANPDSSTLYFVTVTDANGCSDIDSVFVRAMYANAGPDVPVCIFDSVQLTASGGVSYVWNASPTLTSFNTASTFAFPQVTTNYIVNATDITGCTDTDTVEVRVNPLPVTSVTHPFTYVCTGGATQITATGGATYIWQPDSTLDTLFGPTPTARPLNLTTNLVDSSWYFVTVIDSNGCVNQDSIGMEVRLLPVTTISNDTVKCPGDTIQLFATGGIGYQWRPNYNISNINDQNPFVSPDTTTTYTAEITAVWGCADTPKVTVIVVDPDAGADQTICRFDSVQLQAGGGVSYQWSPVNGLSDPNIANPMASPFDTTTYVVTVTDSVGCFDTDTMVVTVNLLPPADAGPNDSICIGQTVGLQALGGVIYQWDADTSLSALNIPNPVASNTDTSLFFVTVTDTNGCSARDSVEIIVWPLPPADAGVDQTKCGEPGIQLQATGGVVYQWSPTDSLSNPFIANPIASPIDTTTYFVTVTDTNGCVNIDSMTVSTMYATAGPGGTICFGDSIQLTAGGGIGYTWTPAGSLVNAIGDTVVALPDTSTLYVVTVLDPSGCTDTASSFVNVLPAPPADAGPDTAVCEGLSVTLTASGGVSYLWDNDPTLNPLNQASTVATPTDTTRYFVTVTGANGCEWRDSVDVTWNPLPTADAGPDQTICRFETATLVGAGAQFFLWNTGAVTDTLRVSPPATTQYFLQVTDSNGCVDLDTAQVNVNQLPLVDAGDNTGICIGLSTQLTASGAITYVWDADPSLSPLNDARTTANPLDTTTYFVTGTDINGCSNTDSVTVIVYPLPPADAGRDTAICIFESTRLQASGGINYEWSPETFLDNSGVPNPLSSPLQTITYLVTVTDTNTCVDTSSVTVTVNPLPEVDAGNDTTICENSTGQLRASGALTYVWSPNLNISDINIPRPVVAPPTDQTYTVEGTDVNGCVNTDSVRVFVTPAPEAEGEDSLAICKFQFAFPEVSGGASYIWSTGESTGQIQVDPRTTTEYWVIPIEAGGCPGDTFEITVYVAETLPSALFDANPVEDFYPLPVQFTNLSEGATRFRWDFGDGMTSEEFEPNHTYLAPGEYEAQLWVDNDAGCPDSTTFSFIKVLDFEVFYPNAFTPNGDGYNDFFYIPSGAIQRMEVRIFDRWGREVFASDDPNFQWDGTQNGRHLPEGVYVYQVVSTTFAGQQVERSGSVTLIR